MWYNHALSKFNEGSHNRTLYPGFSKTPSKTDRIAPRIDSHPKVGQLCQPTPYKALRGHSETFYSETTLPHEDEKYVILAHLTHRVSAHNQNHLFSFLIFLNKKKKKKKHNWRVMRKHSRCARDCTILKNRENMRFLKRKWILGSSAKSEIRQINVQNVLQIWNT